MNTLRLSHVLSFSCILLATAPLGNAAVALFANITHDQETGAPGTTPLTTSTGGARPMSSGTAAFVLNDAQTALTMTATILNIDVTGSQTADTFDNLVSAHIHASALLGANAGVVWGFFGTPDNDNNPDNLVVTPLPGGVGGTFTSTWDLAEGNAGTTLTAQIAALTGGLAYINFHTVQFGSGEIRGQIVPEPGSAVFAAAGLLGLLAKRRR